MPGRSDSTRSWSGTVAAPTTCRATSSMPASCSGRCRLRSSRRLGPGLAARCSSTPASRSPATGPSARGPTESPVQIHGIDADLIFVGEGDVDAAREIVATVDDAELSLYSGDQHYFADSTLPLYDPEATALLNRRMLDFLGRVQEVRR